MAKDDRGKIRLIVFELEGSNETLQESMRTVVQALRPAQTRGYVPPPSPALGNTNGEANNGATNSSQQIPLTFDDEVEEPEEVASRTIPGRAKKQTQTRHYTTPKIVPVDLEAGDNSFKAFCQQKNPSNHTDRYLVIAHWFKENQGQDSITKDHIWTCYKSMGWRVVKDIDSIFRSAKKQAVFESGNERASFKITHVGQSKVNAMGGGES